MTEKESTKAGRSDAKSPAAVYPPAAPVPADGRPATAALKPTFRTNMKPSQVAQALRLRREGQKLGVIAEKLGVTMGVVWNVIEAHAAGKVLLSDSEMMDWPQGWTVSVGEMARLYGDLRYDDVRLKPVRGRAS